MKKVAFILFLTLLLSFTKKRTFIPPGTVQINETFFADECEVNNLSWLEYEYWTATTYGTNSPEHLAVKPDTLVWRHLSNYNEPYMQMYYRHSAFWKYPVVGISHEQAQDFCKWRTERVKSFYYKRYKKELNIRYRLPTREEWEFLATIGPNVISRNVQNPPQLNCASARDTASHFGNAHSTMYVYAYEKNYFGLYNLAGNVAEMVSEKGICKGGSWKHLPEECRFGKNISYSKPEAWLGFRCVCDLS